MVDDVHLLLLVAEGERLVVATELAIDTVRHNQDADPAGRLHLLELRRQLLVELYSLHTCVERLAVVEHVEHGGSVSIELVVRLRLLVVDDARPLVEDEQHAGADQMVYTAIPLELGRQVVFFIVVRGMVGGDPDLLLDRHVHAVKLPHEGDDAMFEGFENGHGYV